MLLGCLGGVPSCHSYKVCIVMKASGAKTRMWVVLLGCTFMFLYFDTSLRPFLGVIPKCAFGGLVFSLGVDFLSGSLLESRARVAPVEWRAVVFTALMTYFNVLIGIVFGCMLTMALFVVEYAGITGIVNQKNIVEVRSLLKRPQRQVEVLDMYGTEVTVFWCSGYIFFGTATGIVEEVEAHLDANDKIRDVVIDFEAVPAVDASGVHALTEFASRCATRKPRVEVCFCGLVRRLHGALASMIAAKDIQQGPKLMSSRLEGALEWAEERILERPRKQVLAVATSPRGHVSREGSKASLSSEAGTVSGYLLDMLNEVAASAPEAALEGLVAALAPSARLQQYFANSPSMKGGANKGMIYLEDTPAFDLIYLTTGAVKLTRMLDAETTHKLPRHHLNIEKGDLFVFEERTEVRVELLERGAVLGAVEFGAANFGVQQGLQPRHLTSALAAPRCEALLVPFKALHEAFAQHPVAGYAAMAWLSSQASAQVLELTRSSSMRSYRLRVADEPLFSQVSASGEEESAPPLVDTNAGG
mmetsp:Transcript_29086/g.83511  ORF Transcript_29086/g.83511 Transcript_29086/m.83511 type:complete len:531 (+) Transcript_29086:1-1593(+)